jgi:hypothetical protein
MIKRNSPLKLGLLFIIVLTLFASGCSIIRPKVSVKRSVLLKTENATQAELFDQIDHFGKVNSMYAKMYLKFEDNSYAEVGIAEKYKTADAIIVVQRPDNIQLKVQIPIIKTDLVQMSSNGEKFCIAILQDGGDGKYKKFVCGTNAADYSPLEEEVKNLEVDKSGKVLKQNVNAFASLRPQHFTDAILMRPVDMENYTYLKSTVTQEEIELDEKKKRPKSWFLRGYYLLEEFHKNGDGSLKISRRFWFDRVGQVRLARQQIFDSEGEIDADIVYGKLGNLTKSGTYDNLPLEIELTRPKEKYKMRLTYQSPELVSIGKTYPQEAFVLENEKNLPVVDLDLKLQEVLTKKGIGNNMPKAEAKSQ